MNERRPFQLENGRGAQLQGFADMPEGPGPHPVVVVCHGFKGFMEWGFFPPLAELLCARGFLVVRFNFSGSGMEPGEDRVTDFEGFRQNTFSGDLADLLAVLDGLETLVDGRGDLDRVGLLGHSRGGGCALLGAADEAWRDRLKALVTWASVGTFDRYPEEMKKTWRQEGEWVVLNGRTGQQLPIGLGLLDDLETNAAALDLEAAAGRRRAPWLIVHGEDDETVAVSDAHALAEAAADPAQLLVVKGASHTFGSRHPFQGPTRELIEAMNATQTWFRRHL